MNRQLILGVLGTRPEAVKLSPVLLEFAKRRDAIRTVTVSSGQHAHLISPFTEFFGVHIDHDLCIVGPNQDYATLLRRIVWSLASVIRRENPDLILVQGDTTTALAGAIAGQQCRVPVAHIEAGLRSGDLRSPYPEEIHRISITQIASFHFAATDSNRDVLLREGVLHSAIEVTGNPIVDALKFVLARQKKGVGQTANGSIAPKRIVLTTHRRESFGTTLESNLRTIRYFIEDHADTELLFPVHPNPNIKVPAYRILGNHPRITLTPPLPYTDFITLLSNCWLVISDSGGVQEEVPSLGKPLLILRDNTERQECIEAGVARLVGSGPGRLRNMLDEAHESDSWVSRVHEIPNPFGDGHSAERIASRCISLLSQGADYRSFAARIKFPGCTHAPAALQHPL